MENNTAQETPDQNNDNRDNIDSPMSAEKELIDKKINTSPTELPLNDKPKKEKTNKNKFHSHLFMIPVIVFVFLFISTLTVSALVVYDVIPVRNAKLKNTLTVLLMKIPLLPRTKSYVVYKMAEAHKNFASANVDFSTAISIPELSNALGMSEFDFVVKGPIDFTNKEIPEIDINIALTTELDVDLKMVDKGLYFRVNKIPTLIKSVVNATSEDKLTQFMDVWVYHDITPLESEARDTLDTFQEEEGTINKELQEDLMEYLTNDVFSKMEMTEEKLGDYDTYKLTLRLENQEFTRMMKEINAIMNRHTSDDVNDSARMNSFREESLSGVETVVYTIWSDKKDHFARKMSVSMRVKPTVFENIDYNYSNPNVLGVDTIENPVDMTFVLKLEDFGKDFTIEKPAEYITLEEYMSTFVADVVYSGNESVTFINEHQSLAGLVKQYWIQNGTPPEDFAAIYELYPMELTYNSMAYSPQANTVVVYGVSPTPEDITKPVYVTVITSADQEMSSYLSLDEAQQFADSYGIDTSFLTIPEVVETPELPEVPEIPVETEESEEVPDESDTPFGKLLN